MLWESVYLPYKNTFQYFAMRVQSWKDFSTLLQLENNCYENANNFNIYFMLITTNLMARVITEFCFLLDMSVKIKTINSPFVSIMSEVRYVLMFMTSGTALCLLLNNYKSDKFFWWQRQLVISNYSLAKNIINNACG